MKHLVFKKQVEYDIFNDRFFDEDSIDFEREDLMSEEDILIRDAALFAHEAYVDNEFRTLYGFAIRASGSEGSTIRNCYRRLKKMIKMGILEVKQK
jgi:hypothetical protein